MYIHPPTHLPVVPQRSTNVAVRLQHPHDDTIHFSRRFFVTLIVREGVLFRGFTCASQKLLLLAFVCGCWCEVDVYVCVFFGIYFSPGTESATRTTKQHLAINVYSHPQHRSTLSFILLAASCSTDCCRCVPVPFGHYHSDRTIADAVVDAAAAAAAVWVASVDAGSRCCPRIPRRRSC